MGYPEACRRLPASGPSVDVAVYGSLQTLDHEIPQPAFHFIGRIPLMPSQQHGALHVGRQWQEVAVEDIQDGPSRRLSVRRLRPVAWFARSQGNSPGTGVLPRWLSPGGASGGIATARRRREGIAIAVREALC